MPQARDEDRELMRTWFGDIDTHGPEKLLRSHGYVLTQGWNWVKPTPAHRMSEIEAACANFLTDEWDYGFVYPMEAQANGQS